MNIPDNLLDEAWYWAAWAVWGLLFVRTSLKAPWARLKNSQQLNVWLGMIVLLTLVWSMKAGVKPGLYLHLTGVMVFTLSFGPQLAFIGLSFVLLGITLNGVIDPFAYAMNALLVPGVGVVLAHAIYRVISKGLPHNFFIYIFVNAFFGAGLTIVGIGVVSTLVFASAGIYGWEYLTSEYLPYFLLLGFSEAWLSGMVITLFVIYRPDWVSTFDDASYLANK